MVISYYLSHHVEKKLFSSNTICSEEYEKLCLMRRNNAWLSFSYGKKWYSPRHLYRGNGYIISMFGGGGMAAMSVYTPF